ncbi:SDR family oxidoreductase [Marinomonas flavescens]|uniref:SDR family oxidoreductase n=1 Tax=Marinomonas flavescens TaxID=2529379 RepID=UPI0010568B35|nr:SDR family oxidoreductase [Marinomonas flavescens]
MESKLVLITGGSRGIGAETAILAAQKGWDVVITYRNEISKAELIVNKIINLGCRALAIKTDIANEQDIYNLFNIIDKEFGRLDALVNNAGAITVISSFVDMSPARIRDVFNINVVGSFICAQEAVKRMSHESGGKGGSIINISSAAARIGSPNEFIDYAASKGAIDTLTLGLSKEVASEGIRVNAVRPGLISTDMHADAGDRDRPEKLKKFIPMQRAGKPSEVANSIVWLISDEASYVNGALLDVAGGR